MHSERHLLPSAGKAVGNGVRGSRAELGRGTLQSIERVVTDGLSWGTTGERRAYYADRLGKPNRWSGLPFFVGERAVERVALRRGGAQGAWLPGRRGRWSSGAQRAGLLPAPPPAGRCRRERRPGAREKGMCMQDLVELLSNNPYPGRGIVVGKGADGAPVIYYFIMGRSSNSRNRIFALEPDGIRTEAHDPALLEDPSLIIYHPVRTMGDALVVTNGDQTDTIVEAGDFRAGCMQREYEPDAPNFTPRISAIVNPDGTFEMSILKHADGDRCTREFFVYEGAEPGTGYFISTYQGDGNPLPTFAGEPIPVALPEPDVLWAALNDDNKVSLYANVNGDVKLFNKNLGD